MISNNTVSNTNNNDIVVARIFQNDIELLNNLKKSFEKTNVLEQSKSWKYGQQWDFLQGNPERLDEIVDLFNGTSEILKYHFKEGLEPIDDLAQGNLDKYFPKYHQALVFTIFLHMSYFPSHILGKDYSSTPWKISLYEQAVQLVEKFNVLSKNISADSLESTLKTCQEIQILWKNLILNYFQEAFRSGNDWTREECSYIADEYPMTPDQLEGANSYSLSLIKEMSRPPEDDIILIAGGSAARTDQQYPIYIQKLANQHPDKKIKIFMIDPFFITNHPSLNTDWMAIDNDGNQVAYSNRFIKGNVEVIVCREGFACTEEELSVIKTYLSKALDQGARIFLGNHCSNVARYLPDLYNQLKLQYAAPNQIALYDEHGEGIVKVWKESLYDERTSDILETILKSKLKSKDVEKKLKNLKKFSEEEIQKMIEDYRHGKLNLGYELRPTMDDLSF